MGSVDRNTSAVIPPGGSLVAPRMGSVDRNWQDSAKDYYWGAVAPRMGSVDRNIQLSRYVRNLYVAPRMGSVDRNPTL